MDVSRQNGKLAIRLNLFEAPLLRRSLEVLAENYRVPPADLDPATAAVWYSSRGCRTAGLSAEETRDWLASLHEFKNAHLRRLEDWIAQLAGVKPAGVTLLLELEAVDAFLVIVNDYRLLLAARHDIGEAEMDLLTDKAIESLAPARQAALMEIHYLAWLIEEVLRALNET